MFKKAKQKLIDFKNWVKRNVKKVALALGIGAVSVALAAGSLEPGEIPSVMIDGQEMIMAYTDDNTNEDLIIRTNKENYFNLTGNFIVYFSVTNNSDAQWVDVVMSFDKDKKDKKFVKEIQEYAGTTTEDLVIPGHVIGGYQNTTTNEWITEESIEEAIVKIEKTIWNEHNLSDFVLSNVKDKVKNQVKSIKNAEGVKKNTFYLAAGETKFFKSIVSYTDFKDKEEFFLEAFGEKSYGHLDPWTFEDLFNSDTKSTGNLNTQDGWAADAIFQVVTTNPFEGDQHVHAVGATEVFAIQSGLANAGGIFYTAMKFSSITTDSREIRIYARDDGGLWDWGIRRDTGNIRAYFRHAGGYDYMETDSDSNTWYIWACEFSPNEGGAGVHQIKYKWKKEGGSWSAWTGWKDDLTAGDGTIDNLWLVCDTDATGQWDAITPTDLTVSNYNPVITSVTDSPDPVIVGSDLSFSVDWNDDNSEGVKVLVCKTDSVSSTTPSCGGGAWASWLSSHTTTDPMIVTYRGQTADVGSHDYYAFVCDDAPSCSTSTLTTATGTFDVVAASTSGIDLRGGQINL